VKADRHERSLRLATSFDSAGQSITRTPSFRQFVEGGPATTYNALSGLGHVGSFFAKEEAKTEASTRQACRDGALVKADQSILASPSSMGEKEKTPRTMNQFTYVYILRSKINLEHFYVGRTRDLRAHVSRHNSGQVPHTSKWKSWRLKLI
jgi:hypothetical protein